MSYLQAYPVPVLVQQCQVWGCNQPMKNPRSGHYCHEHTCDVQNCGAVVGEGGKLCQGHRCRGTCTKRAVQLNGWCEVHMQTLCQYAGGCHLPQEVPDVWKFCSNHTCTWPLSRCGRGKMASPPGAFCEQHTCSSPTGCGNSKSSQVTYCATHECATDHCHGPKTDGFEACSYHRCSQLMGLLPGGPPFVPVQCRHAVSCLVGKDRHGKTTYKIYSFCVHHRCQIPNCPEGTTKRYCSRHRCRYKEGDRNCDNPAKNPPGDPFCESHRLIALVNGLYKKGKTPRS
ncbi:hypothetical protein B0H67DRAFT_572346 [Lasiosphaeris hirsuta]|uniref:Uncharacterized protein n=1 Tax=Lasiosphaeris hirsuta TaxID=260670 RepID=A0AA40E3V4_9PEZI|nr:hypothetical protein B0H67DRAFT_572346 [Lasiosphaeris hirsuta]